MGLWQYVVVDQTSHLLYLAAKQVSRRQAMHASCLEMDCLPAAGEANQAGSRYATVSYAFWADCIAAVDAARC